MIIVCLRMNSENTTIFALSLKQLSELLLNKSVIFSYKAFFPPRPLVERLVEPQSVAAVLQKNCSHALLMPMPLLPFTYNHLHPPSPPPFTLTWYAKGRGVVRDANFYDFFPDRPARSLFSVDAESQESGVLAAACWWPPQATRITGHSPASSCSWGKGCPSPLLAPLA